MEINKLLQSGMAAQSGGRADAARRDFEAVLELAPEHPVALNALGAQALGQRNFAIAADYFARAAAAEPKAPALWINLANAQRALQDHEGERESLNRVLQIDQRHLVALIRLAELHERLGEEAHATQRWAHVLALGRQIDDRAPQFEEVLDRAAAYVTERTRKLAETLDQGLAPFRAAATIRERRRFETCVEREFGHRTIYANQCSGVHFPFLPADEFFDREHFPWLEELETHTDEIRAELKALLQEGQQGFRPYVKMDAGTPQNKWTELDNSLAWGAYFLWEYGKDYEDACARCPATAAVLKALPQPRIKGRSPTAFFSLLKPRTRIPPHTGVTNTRSIVHLPLIVPEGCGFRVGGETRQWKVGEAFVFDDTIEHEAWNESDELRAVLIFDVWNPHLTELEKELLTKFYAIADESGHLPEPAEGF